MKENPLVKIKDILEKDKWINVEIQALSEIPTSTPSIEQKIYVADQTGAIPAVLWAKSALAGVPLLESGKSYLLENVVTNEYRGQFSIALVKSSKVQAIADLGIDKGGY